MLYTTKSNWNIFQNIPTDVGYWATDVSHIIPWISLCEALPLVAKACSEASCRPFKKDSLLCSFIVPGGYIISYLYIYSTVWLIYWSFKILTKSAQKIYVSDLLQHISFIRFISKYIFHYRYLCFNISIFSLTLVKYREFDWYKLNKFRMETLCVYV